jgi:Protein of unknown function (DUF3224)
MTDDTLTGTATFTSWAEEPAHGPEAPTPRLAHAVAAFAYRGDIEGPSECHYVLHYAAADAGSVVGLERIAAAGGVRVLRHEGTFGPEGVDIRFTDEAGATGGFHAGPEAKEWSWRLSGGGRTK